MHINEPHGDRDFLHGEISGIALLCYFNEIMKLYFAQSPEDGASGAVRRTSYNLGPCEWSHSGLLSFRAPYYLLTNSHSFQIQLYLCPSIVTLFVCSMCIVSQSNGGSLVTHQTHLDHRYFFFCLIAVYLFSTHSSRAECNYVLPHFEQ